MRSGARVAVAAIALEPLDLTALEPGAQATCLEVMARLLCGLEVPLQFVVRRRRVTAPGRAASGGPVGGVADALDHAVRTHHARLLGALPAHRNEVLLVMRCDRGRVGVLCPASWRWPSSCSAQRACAAGPAISTISQPRHR